MHIAQGWRYREVQAGSACGAQGRMNRMFVKEAQGRPDKTPVSAMAGVFLWANGTAD